MLRCLCGIVLAAVLPAQSGRTPVPVEEAAPDDPALVAQAQRQLLAEPLAEVAQGACLAAEHRLRATLPQLRGALTRVRDREVLAQRLCAAAVLDALVRIDAKVPPAELAPFLGDDRNAAALVLLARSVVEASRVPAPSGHAATADEVNDVLLEFLRTADPSRRDWLAAGGLLVRARASGLGAVLTGHLHLDLEVSVRDDDRIAAFLAGPGFRCAVSEVDKSFPKIAVYGLSEIRSEGDAELVGGPYPVFHRRRVADGFDGTLVGLARERPERVCLTWLASLAGIRPESLGFEAQTRLEVRSSDAQDLLDRVAAARARIEAGWHALRGELLRHRLLDRGDPRSDASFVRVYVYDERANPEPELPRVPDALVQVRR